MSGSSEQHVPTTTNPHLVALASTIYSFVWRTSIHDCRYFENLPGFYGDLGAIAAILAKLPRLGAEMWSQCPFFFGPAVVFSNLPGLTGQWAPALAKIDGPGLTISGCSVSGGPACKVLCFPTAFVTAMKCR